MEYLHQRLSPHAEVRGLIELGVEDTLQYVPYEDESQNAEMFPILDKEPKVTQQWGPVCKCRDLEAKLMPMVT